ncbi:MAG TPA: IspD/TarI family cytidylyltransferase [Myxococcota bacterium]|nr:IspD/TarI family cytidylyltransferase [Myxococcota bacterium]HOA12521.1 IspD/TarI family cytidylyltransferase [Myxococcota bacterium]HOD00612.1 IspD/TarI family cytidylyltransferase [Myxococcota bacterium]HOH75826.1 IspD/TarI family cytidylyltransferase [Myxococcota bacterium]HPV03421.1 IspD/TarI family cytidylyltransferase [Myxococcota bacterium]
MVFKTVAVVVGAGMGRRVGTRRPKQFEEVSGRPLITYTLDIFDRMAEIDGIIVVVPADWVDFTRAMVTRCQYSRIIDVIPGGASRQMSSFSGVILARRFGGPHLKKIVVHDAVRPLASVELVQKVLKAADRTGAATAAARVTDTIFSISGDTVTGVVDRSSLVAVQTPQAFDPELLVQAHRNALTAGITDASDDVGLVLRDGGSAVVVESDTGNLKITYGSDMRLLERLLETVKDE